MGFIPAHGGYEELLSYQKALIVYDGTVCFCGRFLRVGDRTIDQMVQAARSGKQNIAEGSMLSGVSKEAELKLTGTAKGSLEELLKDFEDFLRVRKMQVWEKNSKEAAYVRRLGSRKGVSYEVFRPFVESRPADVVANIMICLVNQATYLLKRQLAALEEAFVKEGGLRERMTRARLEERERQRRGETEVGLVGRVRPVGQVGPEKAKAASPTRPTRPKGPTGPSRNVGQRPNS